MDLRELYQDIILDHGQHPRNKRAIDHPSHFAHGNNPLCGDKVTVYLKMDGERVADVSFEGRGCAISTAAASLMTEVLKGKTTAEADALLRAFTAKLTGGDEPETAPALADDIDRLEDGVCIENVGFQQCQYQALAQPQCGLSFTENGVRRIVLFR